MSIWTEARQDEINFGGAGTGNTPDFTGDILNLRLGAEKSFNEKLTIGLAASRIEGELDFSDTTNSLKGDMEAKGWNLNPYLAWSGDSHRFWAMVGVGTSELDYMGEGLAGGQQVSDKADLEANMVALGTEHDLIVMEGVEFLGRLEAVSMQINADEADGKAFAKQSNRVSGARGELELGLPQTVEDRHMRPYLALGYRWDGGDGKKGSVFEFGAGVSVQKKHFILEASARFQADPDKGEYERTSYALSLTHDL